MHVSLISEKLSIRCGMKVFFTAFFNMILGGKRLRTYLISILEKQLFC